MELHGWSRVGCHRLGMKTKVVNVLPFNSPLKLSDHVADHVKRFRKHLSSILTAEFGKGLMSSVPVCRLSPTVGFIVIPLHFHIRVSNGWFNLGNGVITPLDFDVVIVSVRPWVTSFTNPISAKLASRPTGAAR